MPPSKKCPVTGKEMRPVFTHRVLGKYDITYFFSDESGLIQTEEPYWLKEAYESVIFPLDTTVAARNYGNARRLEPILSLLFPENSAYVDTAAGYGLFARLMRDKGFDFYAYDRFCENLFTKGFEAPAGIAATAVTAFEVMEHVADPVAFLSEQMKQFNTDTVIASTSVFEGSVPPPEWPYYAFECGQHITIYQPRSFELIAGRLGASYTRLAPDLHMISKRPVSAWKKFVLTAKFVRAAHREANRLLRRKRTLIAADYEVLLSRMKTAAAKSPPRTK
jgi:hypothetical protein